MKLSYPKFFSGLWLCSGLMLSASLAAAPAANPLINDDDRFMALRDAAFHDDSKAAAAHAARLTQYDIPSYVEYYALRARLGSSGYDDVRAFLDKYAGTAVADRLRNDWLLLLGRRNEWTLFDQQYPQFVLADDQQLRCYALQSRASRQQNVSEEARKLLSTPRDFGEGCYSLLNYLAANGQFSEADLWSEMRMATEYGAQPLAMRIGKLLDLPEKKLQMAFEQPQKLLKNPPDSNKKTRRLYLIAIGRLAKSDTDEAAQKLQRYSNRFSDAERQAGWALIALQSAQKLEPEAIGYWSRADGISLTNEAWQWRVRSSLRELDWKQVRNTINAMPAGLRAEPVWTYWLGRALKAEGRNEEARALFAGIADQMHFYGQLATEELGQKIGVPAISRPIGNDEVAALEKNPNLQRALRFYGMNLRLEGNREWNWELRKFSERQHLAAAELARRNNMLDRMVNTSDRTRTEVDVNQRFPTPYNDSMYKTTQALGLDMAWVYGLIRQESRFVMSAKSHVGASGLMQIMPATARYVAKKIGFGEFVPNQVNDTETNITLGTNYLNMVLSDLGGSQALASAAYNAGPGRPRAWRAKLSKPVEGAVFAETIPFNETRSYVKNVLSNATYYAAILEKKPQSLKARLGVVVPKGMSASDNNLPDEPESNAKY